VPVYLSVTKHLPAPARRRAAIRTTIITFFLLAGFLYFGELLLGVILIQLLSFQIAGGIVLFLFSLTMVFEKASSHAAPLELGIFVSTFYKYSAATALIHNGFPHQRPTHFHRRAILRLTISG